MNTGAAAARFLTEQTRPLERALLRFHFAGGPREEVLRELAAYQNPDGGFGHASEPDLRTPDSSAVATSHRLQLLRELQVDAGHPLVRGAMDYPRTTCDRQEHVWPIIPPTAHNAPHAPWWTAKDLAKSWNGFRANPTAELAGYFFVFGTPDDEPVRQPVLPAAGWEHRVRRTGARKRDPGGDWSLGMLSGMFSAMKPHELKCIVHSDPETMGGTPVVVGTRVPLQNLVDYLEGGESIEDFLDAFPTVKREQVIAVIEAGKIAILQTA